LDFYLSFRNKPNL